MKNKALIAILIFALIFIGAFVCHSLQDSGKNEIRILIDRAPNTLDLSQNPDVTARKIFPLLREFSYRLRPDWKSEDFILDLPSQPSLHFKVVKDDLTKSILFLHGDVDILYDTLSLSKSEWMKTHGHAVFESQGHKFSYIGFQTEDPILKNLKVRKAISLALPVEDWVKYKFFDWVSVIPNTELHPNLKLANSLLDESSFPRRSDGIRFSLNYLTTQVREGNEMAFLVREALKPLGIDVQIILIDTSLFFHKLKGGNFQLFGSSLVRNTGADPAFEVFSKTGIRNYFRYSSESLEQHFKVDKNYSFDKSMKQIMEDLPLIPLFEWKHGLIVSDRIKVPPEIEKHFDDSFRFLTELQLK